MLLPYRIRKFKFLNILSEVSLLRLAIVRRWQNLPYRVQFTHLPYYAFSYPQESVIFNQSPCRNRFTRKFSVQFYFAVQELGL